jgi:hypothetical protein
VFIKDAGKDPEITGCTDNCKTTANLQYDVNALFVINAIDMVVEILSILFLTCSILSEAFEIAGALQIGFGVFDFALQVAALVYINVIDNAANPFTDALCLDTTTSSGLKHHDTLIKLQESVSTSRMLFKSF